MMKISEIFGSIFGSPVERMGPNDLPRNIEEDLMREFGSPRGDEQINMPFEGWWGVHSQDRVNPGEMGSSLFEEMDEMFREFFRGIDSNSEEFESLTPQFPPLLGSPECDQRDDNQYQIGSLRDRMLNKDSKEWRSNKSYQDEDIDNQTRENMPFHGPLSSLFGELWSHPSQQSPSIEGQNRADKDLDHELEQGKQSLDDILTQQEDDRHVALGSPHHSSSFYSSTTILGSDGIAESKTTRKDSDGNEEITITRRMGDQKYTVTHRIDGSGNEETREDFVNIDKDKVAEFDENFSHSRKRGSKGPSLLLSPDNADRSQYDSTPFSSLYDSILDRFFRR